MDSYTSQFKYSKEGKSVIFRYFVDIVPSKTCKIDLKWPRPGPTFRPGMAQRVNIFNFCKKHVKVHKICKLICSNWKKSIFKWRPPPAPLSEWVHISTLIAISEDSLKLYLLLQFLLPGPQNWPSYCKKLFLEIHQTNFWFFDFWAIYGRF